MKPILRTIWNTLGRLAGKHHKMIPAREGSPDAQGSPVCAFCGQLAKEMPCTHDETDRLQPSAGCHPFAKRYLAHAFGLWECTCTAIGSGAWAPDLDEVADLLLELLGIDLSVSQPVVPIDDSPMISVQRYDAAEVKSDLGEVLRQRGYELRVNQFQQHSVPIQCLWVRRIRTEANKPEA